MTVVEHHPAEELQGLFRREKDACVVKRIWVVWQARAGLTEPQIRAGIGMTRRAVQDWVRRNNDEGLVGLRDRAGRGRKPSLSPEEQQAVIQRLNAEPQEGDVSSLRGLDFQKFNEDQLAKLMSLSAVYGLLYDLDYKWLVLQSKYRKSDPDEIAAFKRKSRKSWRRFRPSIPTNTSSRSFKMSVGSVSRELVVLVTKASDRSSPHAREV